MKGKAEPLRAWRVVSVVPPVRTEVLEAPLIDRQAELGRLHHALDDAIAARACRLVSVIGSPGLGKSRPAREFAAALGDTVTLLEGHCEPSGEGITFLPPPVRSWRPAASRWKSWV